jgi:tRNA(Ile)-lysidine synthase
MRDVIEAVRDTIRRYRMISERDTVLAAVSGGPDSVCMLHVLVGLSEELRFDLRVAHLDHRFRGEESRADAKFVEELADGFGLPCRCEEENVPAFLLSHAMSKQDAARMIRYRFLIRVAKQEYCQRIATGHNADDQAETVLMRVMRGAGPDGLAGIPPKRDGMIIRPILSLWRSEIDQYLAEHDLPCRIDATNLESACLRNQVRNDLLPDLERYNPSISRSLVNLASIMTDVSAHFERLTDLAMPELVKSARLGQFALDSAKLSGYDEALQRSVFRKVFESLRPDLAPLSFRHVEGMLSLVRRGEVGVGVDLPGGARARQEHGQLVVSGGPRPADLPSKELSVPGTTAFEEAGLTVTAELLPRRDVESSPDAVSDDVALFDWENVRPPLTVRGRREGDRFRPFGMEGSKSLKHLFIDSKVAASFRSAVPLVCDRGGIMWVVGMRRSDTAPVEGTTRTVLRLRAFTTEVETGAGKGSPD